MKKIVFYPMMLVIVFFISVAFVGLPTAQAFLVPDVVINEFSVNGAEWVELMNTTESAIDFDSVSWSLVYSEMGPNGATTTLTGIIPARGLITLSLTNLNDAGGMFTLYKGAASQQAVGYGTWSSPNNVASPASGESAYLTAPNTWNITSTPSKGWFNNAVDIPDCNDMSGLSAPPKLSALDACLESLGIVSNMGELANPAHTPNDGANNLYFEKRTSSTDPSTAIGKIKYNNSLNLTDRNTTELLKALGDQMEINQGEVGLNASTSDMMRNSGAEITIYNIDDLGYSDIPIIVVRDDEGNIIDPEDPDFPELTGTDYEDGDLTFSTDHFTDFQTGPSVTEVTLVPDPTTDKTPNYTFNTDVAGTGNIEYGGDCSSTATSSVIGDNTITFNTLSTGLHDSCTITIHDGAGHSSTLDISQFTIISDEVPPEVESSYLNVAGSYVNRPMIGSSTFSYVVTFNEDMDTDIDPTIIFDPALDDVLINRYYSWSGAREVRLIADVVSQEIEGQTVTSTISAAKDLAGNAVVTVSSPNEFSVDLIAPATPAIATLNSATSSSQTSTVSGPEITLSGLTVGEYYYVYDYFNGSTSTVVSRLSTAGTEINYLDLDEGTHVFTAQTSDHANNYSDYSASKTYTLVALTDAYVDDDYDSDDAGGHTWGVDAFNNIQDGINAVAASGTVYVAAGTYNENVTIDKSLTLTGAGTSTVSVNSGNSSSYVFDVNASDVNISGFTISGAGSSAGIYLDEVDGCDISDNYLTDNKYGIWLFYADDNTLTSNTANENNQIGFFLVGSTGNELTTNSANSNANGFRLQVSSNENTLTGNTANSNNRGIHILHSSSNTFTDNTISENTSDGFYLQNNSDNNEITGNTINENGGAGIYLDSGTGNSIQNNTIANNGLMLPGTGIHVMYALGNSAHNNKILNDGQDKGVYNHDESNVFDATQNYWGSANGPFEDGVNPTGNASSSVSGSAAGNVSYSPWYNSDSMNSLSGITTTTPDGDKVYVVTTEFNSTSTDSSLHLTIPASTTITGSSTWDGTINQPTVTTITNPPSESGYTTNMGTALEVGFLNGKLILDQAAELVFPGEHGKRVGFTWPGESFTEITTVCATSSQSWANDVANLGTEGDCKIDVGSDLVVWTKHFTKFATYTMTSNSGGSTGGGFTNIDYTKFIIPDGGFSVKINNGAASTDVTNVTLMLNGGADAKNMAISNSSDFSGISQQAYAASLPWTLTAGNGAKTVYVKFYNQYGSPSDIVSASIVLSGQATNQTVTPTVAPTVTAVVSNEQSPVVISDISTGSIQPGTNLRYTYGYLNNTAKSAKLTITRQLLNSKGKVIRSYPGTRVLKAGKSLSVDVVQLIAKTTVPGDYTVLVKINNKTNKQTYSNSFALTVEKLKKKYFELGSVNSAGGIVFFDTKSVSKIKAEKLLPNSVGFKYGYDNSAGAKQTIKIVRELVGPNGKALATKTGKWRMVAGEKYAYGATQYLGSTLSNGDYQIRVRAYDWTTKELLAENALTFSVVLK